ncbi:carbonic anhydrase 14 isoform X2 [Manacus candei]|uniref:carbonic anhydrase 14 isoform X2 n=1 Tax=Manacus candei TaxID=415023 RepID=UPI002227B1A5|nr:carbonic anhydrase 14 isoform X2 [Manacus candei]
MAWELGGKWVWGWEMVVGRGLSGGNGTGTVWCRGLHAGMWCREWKWGRGVGMGKEMDPGMGNECREGTGCRKEKRGEMGTALGTGSGSGHCGRCSSVGSGGSVGLLGVPQMHVVHFDAERFSDAGEAQHHAGGLAVLGVLLEVGADPHPAYDNILRHLGSIRYAGQSTSIPSFSVQDLLPPRLDRYYRYNGSLTTPPCFQSVLWTLFPEPVHISRDQLEQLQGSLYSTEEAEAEPQLLVDNFRAPQELNQRPVLVSFPREPEGYSTGEVIAIIFGAVAGCVGLFLAVHFGAKRMRSRRAQAQDVVFKASSRRSPGDSGISR